MYLMKKKYFSSAQLIPISFLAAIIIGALLLMLPFASVDGQWTSFVDALFTSATSICVIGLTVLDTGNHWNLRKSYEVNIVAKQEKKGCKWELIEPTAKLNADCRLLIVLEKSRLGKLK